MNGRGQDDDTARTARSLQSDRNHDLLKCEEKEEKIKLQTLFETDCVYIVRLRNTQYVQVLPPLDFNAKLVIFMQN